MGKMMLIPFVKQDDTTQAPQVPSLITQTSIQRNKQCI